MSRRGYVARTTSQPKAARGRVADGPFSWNASLLDHYAALTVYSGANYELPGTPHHSSLGEQDFAPGETDPYVKIVIPRDGIYSVSALVHVYSGDTPIGTRVSIYLPGNYYGTLGQDERPLVDDPRDPGGMRSALLQAGNAGYPFAGGDAVLVHGYHFDETSSVQMKLLELSVTYEAELGTVYPPIGGG